VGARGAFDQVAPRGSAAGGGDEGPASPAKTLNAMFRETVARQPDADRSGSFGIIDGLGRRRQAFGTGSEQPVPPGQPGRTRMRGNPPENMMSWPGHEDPRKWRPKPADRRRPGGPRYPEGKSTVTRRIQLSVQAGVKVEPGPGSQSDRVVHLLVGRAGRRNATTCLPAGKRNVLIT